MARSRSANPARTSRGYMWHPHSGSTQMMWFRYKPVGAHRPISGPFALLHTSRFPSPWIVSPLGGHISFLISVPTQKQAEVGAACLALASSNAFFSFSSPSPSCLLHCRPAWYDLPPPPYSSDTESLNQADLPPYRSRSGSADSASSQAASSLLSTEDTGHSPGQPGPQEGAPEPRDSVPSQGTEEV